MPLDPGRVQALFLAALEQVTSAGRTEVLDRECAADEALRRRVEDLLRAHDDQATVHARPTLDLTKHPKAQPARDDARTELLTTEKPEADFAVEQPSTSSGRPVAGATMDEVTAYLAKPSESTNSRIGPYKLLQLIGEGGMGAVYLAEQEKPVRRRVALKIIKPGTDSVEFIARFEAERQALALMDHQSIARVLDAGTTAGGRPYFVMELVLGVPITQYCDDAQLTLRERLELFIPVCQAIQHAHQKGIIHRDIKPSNILVTLYDGRPVPKVIDFGVAKATDQRLTEQTMFTQYGAIVGTLEYMSPEQAELSALGVDTRSDIYSLGVVLYELMTGTTPLERGQVDRSGYVDIMKRIKDEVTPRPSTRIKDTNDAIVSISARRRTEASKLSKLICGELDWIVMKALDKDRSRRYETANGFARDLRRFLDGDAVEACPPSTSYRLRKFAGRNRSALVATSAFAGLLVVGIVLSVWQAIRATRAEALARAESEKSSRAAAESRAVLDFFEKQVLAGARPEGQDGGLGTDVSVRKAVDTAEARIASAFSDQPSVEASVRYALGSTYRRLGEQTLAIPQLERAGPLRTTVLGPNHPETLSVQNELALAYWGNGQLDRVIPLVEQTLATQRARLGPDHFDTIQSRTDLAVAYLEDDRLELAIPLLEQNLAAAKAKFGPDDIETLNIQNHLGVAYREAGRSTEAIPLLERTLDADRESSKIGPGHPYTLGAQFNLALSYQADGQLQRAIPLLEQTLASRGAKLGLDHPSTLITQNSLAVAYDRAGNDARAEPMFREVLVLRRRRRRPGHPHVAATLVDLGRFLVRRKRYVEAEPLLREGLTIWEGNRPDGWQRFDAQSVYGGSLLGQRRYADAEPVILSGCEGLKARELRIPAPSRARLIEAIERVVSLYTALERPETADIWRAKLPSRVDGENAAPAR